MGVWTSVCGWVGQGVRVHEGACLHVGGWVGGSAVGGWLHAWPALV